MFVSTVKVMEKIQKYKNMNSVSSTLTYRHIYIIKSWNWPWTLPKSKRTNITNSWRIANDSNSLGNSNSNDSYVRSMSNQFQLFFFCLCMRACVGSPQSQKQAISIRSSESHFGNVCSVFAFRSFIHVHYWLI